jgi:hypothetical protein|tara:strand:- start:268 stop:711 length:444 start_codon:yes stop_codon:yes gene_type:complete
MVGYRKPRIVRPKEKNVPKGYDSKWEHKLHTTILKEWEHHSDKISYVVEHEYEPDFVKIIDGKVILLEAKGRFWDYAEYNKYVWIRKAFEEMVEDYELVFLFSSPYSPMPQAKRRKDGTKRTHAEWAEKNNFKWYSEDTLPKEWKDV